MAYYYNISSSPTHLSHDTHIFCNSLARQAPQTRTLNFPPRTQLKTPNLFVSQVSLQEPQVSQTPDGKFASSSSSSNSYIWVNPNSPRAKNLRKKSYDFRYASYVKISQELDECSPVESDVYRVLSTLGENIVEQDAALVLNNMSNSEIAPIVLKYFQERVKFGQEVILYNITLKVFRKNKEFDKAEKLFDEMIARGVKPDNVTFSTIISCARVSSMPEKAIGWFEKMSSFGIQPDNVTYAVMIDSYGKVGNVDMALKLYDRARAEKWRVDAGTFSTLVKIYGTAGNYDGCLNVYEEMKALGVRPNMSIYNSLLDAMGRAKRPWQAKNIFKELVSKGFEPNWGTYAALLRGYARARYGEDAFSLYKEMREKGLELNVVLYNTLLSMSADVGFIDEAVEIFKDMKGCESCKPDSWTYSSMITIFSCSGKVLEAESTLNEMMETGFEPNIFVLTSIIQCYGKANRVDDVVRTFDRMLELNIIPDERFCCCLLNVMTQAPAEELGKLTICMEKADTKLGKVVMLMLDEQDIESDVLQKEAGELFNDVDAGVRKAYCNCLIDLCVKIKRLDRACDLLDLGLTLEIYTGIQSRTPTQWSLNLKSLSLGAALTALHVWINDLSKVLENGEELSSLLGINTGHGKHKYSEKGLATAFESHLKELNAPFHEAPDKAGWFLTTKDAATAWLKSSVSGEAVAG